MSQRVRGLRPTIFAAFIVGLAAPAFAQAPGGRGGGPAAVARAEMPARPTADARLAVAASKRDLPAVRALLAQKVDVNAPDVQGTPALHWAVRVDDVDLAKLLIGAGA